MELFLVYALVRVGCSSISLKPEQKECIQCIFDGKDVFGYLTASESPFVTRFYRQEAWHRQQPCHCCITARFTYG